MYNQQITGTRDEIERQLIHATFSPDVLAHTAVIEYAMAHIPKHTNVKYRLVLNAHSIANMPGSTLAGHITVVVTAV